MGGLCCDSVNLLNVIQLLLKKSSRLNKYLCEFSNFALWMGLITNELAIEVQIQ